MSSGSNKSVSFMCPKCFKKMVKLGNITGDVLLSNPPKWKEVYACHECHVKKTIEVSGTPIVPPNSLDGYEEV